MAHQEFKSPPSSPRKPCSPLVLKPEKVPSRKVSIDPAVEERTPSKMNLRGSSSQITPKTMDWSENKEEFNQGRWTDAEH